MVLSFLRGCQGTDKLLIGICPAVHVVEADFFRGHAVRTEDIQQFPLISAAASRLWEDGFQVSQGVLQHGQQFPVRLDVVLPVVVPQEGQRIPSVLPEKLHLAGFRHPDTHHVAHTLDFLEEGVLQFPHPFAGPGQSLDLTAEIVNQAVKDFPRLLFEIGRAHV